MVILNGDAIKVIRQQDGPRTLFYCDPPYLHETRTTTGEYDHEMTTQQHCDLLAELNTITGRFLLSGYHSPMYDAVAKSAGWRCVEKQIDNKASSKREKEIKTECLWMNY